MPPPSWGYGRLPVRDVAQRRTIVPAALAAHRRGLPYLLTPLIPVAIALELAHASASSIFVTSALGIIPTAALMGRATEELADRARARASAAC